jgi:hypothetical protein
MAIYGHDAAQQDLARALIYRETILAKSSQYGIDPAFVAAIGSRETRWSHIYFLGDIDPVTKLPHGHGPMQIDDRSFPDWCAQYRAGTLTPLDGIDKGCQVIVSKRTALFGEHGLINDKSLDQSMQSRCIAAAYNSGEGRVAKLINGASAACTACGHQELNPDVHTTGGNYGADVMERTEFFAQNGFVVS